MKTLTLFVMLLLLSVSTNAQSLNRNARTIVKDYPFCNEEVLFDVNADMTVKTWDREGVRFMVEVELSSHRPELIKELLLMGRYEIQLLENETSCSFSMPELRKQVEINGLELEEWIHITVYVPKGTQRTLFSEGQVTASWHLP
ncbi:MAG: hypothetical protein AAFV80_22590 [Bacteroidota bacterium]